MPDTSALFKFCAIQVWSSRLLWQRLFIITYCSMHVPFTSLAPHLVLCPLLSYDMWHPFRGRNGSKRAEPKQTTSSYAYSAKERSIIEVAEYSWSECGPVAVAMAPRAEVDPSRGFSMTKATPWGCWGNHTVTISAALVRSTFATRWRLLEPPSSPPEKVRPAQQDSRGKWATDSSLVWQVEWAVTSRNSWPWVRPNTHTGWRVG